MYKIILKYINLLIDGQLKGYAEFEINVPMTLVPSFLCIIDFVCMWIVDGGRAAFQWRGWVTLMLGPS